MKRSVAGQGAGAVVDRDDVDPARGDVGGQDRERGVLGGVAGGAALDHEHLGVAEVRRQGGSDVVLLAGADHDHEPGEVGHAPGPPAPTRPAPAGRASGSSTLLRSAPTRLPEPAARTTTAHGTPGG